MWGSVDSINIGCIWFRHEYPQWAPKTPQEHLHVTNSDKDAVDLLFKMLEYDPSKRITVKPHSSKFHQSSC